MRLPFREAMRAATVRSRIVNSILILAVAAVATFALRHRNHRSFFVGIASSVITSPELGTSFEISCGPRFNQFAVSYVPQNYRDFPLLNGRNVTKGTSWTASQQEHDKGIEADPGDVIEILMYFHNGGFTGEECDEGNAIRTIIQSEVTPPIGQSSLVHKLSGNIRAANALTIRSSDPQKGGDLIVTVRGATPQTLSLVPGSIEERHPQDNNVKDAPYHLLDSIFEEGVDLGSVLPGFKSSGFLVFQVKVSAK